MKKILFLFILFSASSSLSAFDFGLSLETSVSYQSLLFNHQFFSRDDGAEFKFGIGQQVVYYADLKHRGGFNLGFGVGYDSSYDINDNAVGILSDIMGYLGIKRFIIKAKHLSQPGSLTLTKNPAPGQLLTRKFNNKRTTIELLYRIFGEGSYYFQTIHVYLGIYYSFWEMALLNRIDLHEDYNEFGGGFRSGHEIYYHTDVISHIYGVLFGMDTFPYVLNNSWNDGKFAVDFWGEMWVSFGFLELSAEHTLKNEYQLDLEWGPTIDLNLDVTFGILFSVGKKVRFCVGVGYKAETPSLGQISHGVNIRGGIKF